jgi:hypothetical protein
MDSYRPSGRHREPSYRSRSPDEARNSDQGLGHHRYSDLDEPSPRHQRGDRGKSSNSYRPLSESNGSRTVRDTSWNYNEFGRDLLRPRSPSHFPPQPVHKSESKDKRLDTQVSLKSGSAIHFVGANKAIIQKKHKEIGPCSDIPPEASVQVTSNGVVQPVDVHAISPDSVIPTVDTRDDELEQLRAERDQLRTELDQHRSRIEELRAECDQLRAEPDLENQQLAEAREKMHMEFVGTREPVDPSGAGDALLKLLLVSQKRRRELLKASRLSSRRSFDVE